MPREDFPIDDTAEQPFLTELAVVAFTCFGGLLLGLWLWGLYKDALLAIYPSFGILVTIAVARFMFGAYDEVPDSDR